MRETLIAVITCLLWCCFPKPLKAEVWYLPNGQTITTQAGSTPPVIGAQLTPYPDANHVQNGRIQAAPQVFIPPAPSVAQLQDLIPTTLQASSLPQVQPQSKVPKAIVEPIKTSLYFRDAKVGQTGGQCAAFAQYSRPELTGFGNANQMTDNALKNGFEVNGTPQVGSVLVIEKPVGSTYGHAEVVTSVQKLGDKYVLAIMDSNANEDGLVSARTVYYTPSDNGAYGNYGRYEEMSPETTKLAKDLVVMGFINEKVASSIK